MQVATADPTLATAIVAPISSTDVTGMAIWSGASTPGMNDWNGTSFGSSTNTGISRIYDSRLNIDIGSSYLVLKIGNAVLKVFEERNGIFCFGCKICGMLTFYCIVYITL